MEISGFCKMKIRRLDQVSLAETGEEILFSASLSENYQHTGRATIHPQESGGSISDHFIKDPDVITAEAAFSENAVSTIQQFTNFGDTMVGYYKSLVEVWRTGEVFKLITGSDLYPLVVLETIGRPRDKGTKGVRFVSLAFKEMTFAESDEARFKFKPKPEVKPKARETVDKGTKSTTEATKIQQERTTAAYDIFIK